MTSIVKPGSYRQAVRVLLGRLIPAAFDPTTAMTFVQDLATPEIPENMAPQRYIYVISRGRGHVLLLPSPSFSMTTLNFRITILTIPYDSNDYVMHACIISPFFRPRHDDILNLYMLVCWRKISFASAEETRTHVSPLIRALN